VLDAADGRRGRLADLGARLEVTDLVLGVDLVRADTPRDDVRGPRGVVLGLEVELRALARERIGVHEAVRARGDHEAALAGRMVGFDYFERMTTLDRRIEHPDRDRVSGVHQQGVLVRSG